MGGDDVMVIALVNWNLMGCIECGTSAFQVSSNLCIVHQLPDDINSIEVVIPLMGEKATPIDKSTG